MARTGVLTSRKQQRENMQKNHRDQGYGVLFKKSGMPGQKYTSHSSEN